MSVHRHCVKAGATNLMCPPLLVEKGIAGGGRGGVRGCYQQKQRVVKQEQRGTDFA